MTQNFDGVAFLLRNTYSIGNFLSSARELGESPLKFLLIFAQTSIATFEICVLAKKLMY